MPRPCRLPSHSDQDLCAASNTYRRQVHNFLTHRPPSSSSKPLVWCSTLLAWPRWSCLAFWPIICFYMYIQESFRILSGACLLLRLSNWLLTCGTLAVSAAYPWLQLTLTSWALLCQDQTTQWSLRQVCHSNRSFQHWSYLEYLELVGRIHLAGKERRGLQRNP